MPQFLPEWAPAGETPTDLWMERSNLIGLIIGGVAYGILFTIFIQCILVLRSNNGGRRNQWLMVYSGAVFLLATFGIAANTKFVQMCYIDYRNYPGGPNMFTVDFYSTFVNMFGTAAYVVMNWLVDGLMLYRFAIIYDRKPLFILFPGLMYLGILGLSITLLCFMTMPAHGFWDPTTVRIGTAYWSVSVSMNVVITLAIVGRLLKMRRTIQKLLGPKHSSPYTSTLAMIVESAALYTSWALVFIITYARADIFQNIVLPSLGQVQGIAPLLIIFRVAQGKAWTSSTNATASMYGVSPNPKSVNSNPISDITVPNNNSRVTQSLPLTDVSPGSTMQFDIKVGKSTLNSANLEKV
ncbi:hypothetical protein EST38_g12273 [Candolleomyces aberdarensis]|uniref:Uncharacterized protein n=1 Tax=Candolleomyces aberdarensis TaxID=2316362 RepID=A0A4Q2D3K6_9AGAR|nr:hypothetical protein EST38_g12273 [Candolleomyces aberdarensis]